MNSSSPQQLHYSGWRVWEWPIVWAVGICSLLLGTWGFWEHAQDHKEVTTLAESFYRSLQLFILHMGHVELPLNPVLEIARFLAPIVSGYSATRLFWTVFRDHLRLLRLLFIRDHIVICGAGWRGVPLTRSFVERGEKVVVIERAPSCPGLRECGELGLCTTVGDATDPRVLAAARIPRARCVVAVCSDDATNLEIAVHARQLAEAHRRHPWNPSDASHTSATWISARSLEKKVSSPEIRTASCWKPWGSTSTRTARDGCSRTTRWTANPSARPVRRGFI